MIEERVIDLVRKLFAKAESAAEIGSAEEAAAFAGKANDLLLQHKLEMSEVELLDEQDDDPMGIEAMERKQWGGVSEKWSVLLANAIARAHFCRLIRQRDHRDRLGSRFSLVGRGSDREVAVYLITTLHREAKRLAKGFTGHRTSFLLGFQNAVHVRLNERLTAAKEAGGKYAVVRFSDAAKQAEDFAKAQLPGFTTTAHRSSRIHPAAYEAGKAAGRSVGLGGIGDGTHSKGLRLLGA